MPRRRTWPRGMSGASLLSRLGSAASRIGGCGTLARREEIGLELFLLLVGEDGVRTRRRQVVDRWIDRRRRGTLRGILRQAAGRGREVVADDAAGRAAR